MQISKRLKNFWPARVAWETIKLLWSKTPWGRAAEARARAADWYHRYLAALVADDRKQLEVEHAKIRYAMLEVKYNELADRFMWLRAQCMTLRVSQATEGRTGWEVMAYIPEEVVKRITEWKDTDPDLFEGFMFNVARPLVRNAIKGLVQVNSQGRVNALVFEPLNINEEPRAPKWMMALYETSEGTFKFSNKAKLIDPGTPEERAKRASGL